MGELYDRMELDLKLKNLSSRTREQYLRKCSLFVRHYMKSPADLGEAEIKEYLGGLVDQGASPEKLRTFIAALKFLYGVTLGRPEVAARLPWPKVAHKKPDILSLSEVEQLLQEAVSVSLVPAVVSIVAYGAGLRITEACQLRAGDVDSKRMLIHVRLGKGQKDRFVMLSPRLLQILRGYWTKVRPTGDWLFPGQKPGRHLGPTSVRQTSFRTVS